MRLEHKHVAAALGHTNFTLRVEGEESTVLLDGTEKWVDPTKLPEWDQEAHDAAASAPTWRVLPLWAVEGVISDLPGRNPGEATLADTFRNAIEGIEDETTRRIFKGKLSATSEWHRDSVVVEQVRQLLGMTAEEVDDFWTQGEQLVVAAGEMGV